MKGLKYIILTVFVCQFALISGQGIEGKVIDHEGKAVSYASIFIKELSRGTTSNSLGMFSFPLPSGEYTLFFRSLGYSEVTKKIKVEDEVIKLEITMPPQTYMIPEVQVTANGEDPAYRVMRKAIGLANYHLHQVSTYDAEIYIKGTAYFHKLPRAIAKRIEVNNVRVEENTAYMLESLNEVTYRAPDKYDMRIIASQNTIPGYVEAVNPMDYINASLYQPQIESFVSPFARNAFSYYKFSFEGSFLQGNYMIDKIRVIPKRKSQQLCSGFLYIVEDLWCLHSSDLEVSTIAGDLILQQQYANVILDAWLPVSHKLEMEVGIAGVQADVTYVSSLEYKKTVLNPNLPKSFFIAQEAKVEEELKEEPPSKEEEKILEILDKDELSDRDMAKLTKLMEKETENATPDSNKLEVEGTKFSIAPNAVTNDSAYWNSIRPVPLTFEERTTLDERNSDLGIGGPVDTTRTDSVRQVKRNLKPRQLIMGKFYQSADRKLKITYGGLADINMLSYNTVDGWIYGQKVSFDYRPNKTEVYRWNLRAGYAFARKAPAIEWTSSILYAPKIRGKISFKADYRSMDFNTINGIPEFTNTMYSLLYRNNHSKRFENRALNLEHRMDLATGFVFYAGIDYRSIYELENHSYQSIFFRSRENRYDTLNVPAGMDPDLTVFDDRKSLSAYALFEYTPEYYYRLRNGRKQYFKSDYPTFYASYRNAIPMENTGWSDFSKISLGLRHKKEVGLLAEVNYKLEGGYFIHANDLHFSEYAHFKTSPLYFNMQGFEESFQLIDYYASSTNNYYLEAHGSITSPFLFVKLLPWFSERLWTETFSLAFLQSDQINSYIQLGYSLNELGFLLDVGVYAAFMDWKFLGPQFRINFRF